MRKIVRAALVFVCCFFGGMSFAIAESPRFPWLSIAPEVGYQFFGKGTLEEVFHTPVGPRHGAVVKAHVDMGGDKFAVELAPLYAWQGSSGLVGDLNALGGELTLVYRFSAQAVYPNIGVGFHGTYLFPNDNVAYGTELAARIPLGLTWYFFRYLGLVVEGGFMFGSTGIRFKNNAAAPELYGLSEKTEFAFVLGFDLMIGLRFP